MWARAFMWSSDGRSCRRILATSERRSRHPRTSASREHGASHPVGHLVRRHVDVADAAAVEVVEPRLQAHQLGHEVARRRRSGPRRRRSSISRRSLPSARDGDRLGTARAAPASAPGPGWPPAAKPCGANWPGSRSAASAADQQQVVDRLAVEHVEHPAVAVDDPEAPVGALVRRHRRALAELDRRRRAGSRVVTRASSTHGIASSSRSARSVSARSTGVPSRSSTTACERGRVGVHGALDLDVVDGEQRRAEHGQRGDDERPARRRPRAPSAGACGRPPA